MTIPAHGVTALFGPSGCGKTTLLRAIAGLEIGANGYLRIGEEVWQDKTRFVPPHKRSVGYVFQEASLFSHLNVEQNLQYGQKRIAASEQRISLNQSIELLNIDHLLHRKPSQLSGGERQRVAIARALAVSPKILLMDEPLSALDLALKREIMPYLESLNSELNIPVLFVSHEPGELARLADHIVLLDKGREIASSSINDMFTRLDLPLALGDRAAALVEAEVSGYDAEFGLIEMTFAGGRFSASGNALPVGQKIRLRVFARDVSLTLERQKNTSILNIFPVVIDELIPVGAAQLMVRVMAEETPLLARITRKSALNLGLKPGKSVFAQVKSVALLS